MSFGHDWSLSAWPTLGEITEAIAAVVDLTGSSPPSVMHETWPIGRNVDDDLEDDNDDNDGRNESGELDGFGVSDPQQVLPARTTITLIFTYRASNALDVARLLAPDVAIEASDFRPREEIDTMTAGRDGVMQVSFAPVRYTVGIELSGPDPDEEKPACVSVSNNQFNNGEAFPLVSALGEALQRELAIILARS